MTWLYCIEPFISRAQCNFATSSSSSSRSRWLSCFHPLSFLNNYLCPAYQTAYIHTYSLPEWQNSWRRIRYTYRVVFLNQWRGSHYDIASAFIIIIVTLQCIGVGLALKFNTLVHGCDGIWSLFEGISFMFNTLIICTISLCSHIKLSRVRTEIMGTF